MGKTVQTVQETSEMEDQNVQVSADQNVQENAPDDEATQFKKLKASKFIPLFSSKNKKTSHILYELDFTLTFKHFKMSLKK
jgi:hypothetical protein